VLTATLDARIERRLGHNPRDRREGAGRRPPVRRRIDGWWGALHAAAGRRLCRAIRQVRRHHAV